MTADVGGDFLRRNCPCCNSAAARPFLQSEPTAEGSSWEVLAQSWAGFFKRKVFFSYVRCTDCGLLYCPVYFSDAQLARLYGNMADNTAGLGAEGILRTQTAYVSLLPRQDVDGDFLELGPDIGLFTVEYARRFDREARRRYWLFEPNVDVHAELKNRMNGYHTEIRTTLLNMEEIPDNSLGAVVMVHVLDHLLEPKEVLQSLRKKMRAGATLSIVTHNEGSFLAGALKQRWPAFCLQHPQLFQPDTMRRLLQEAGFETTAIRRTKNYFPLTYLARHGLYAVGVNWPALGRMRSPEIGVKLGNMLTAARAA